jgi:O-antigen/teichoic acid export membrane protein
MLAPVVFPTVFGHTWHLIVPITRDLTPFMIMAFVASPCSRVLIAVEHTGIKMGADVVRLIGAPLTIMIASSAQVPFLRAIVWLGSFLAIAYALYFVAEYFSALTVAKRPKALRALPPPSEIRCL